MSFSALVSMLQHYYATELGRIAATGVTVAAGLLLMRLWSRYLLRSSADRPSARTREKLVHARNLLMVGVALIVVAIWASKIAGMFLSLAAVAGAMLLVSKELLMCVLGYGLITTSRSFRVGDFIEIGAMRGRVVDIDVFATTLAETGSAHQLTGKTLSVPNSTMLSQPVRNSSATGEYIVDLLAIVVPFDVDFEQAERAALNAASHVTRAWQAAANAHLQHIEGVQFVDLPSSEPKVLWESHDTKGHTMVVRFACPMMKRVTAEQEIFRRFWLGYRAARAGGSDLPAQGSDAAAVSESKTSS